LGSVLTLLLASTAAATATAASTSTVAAPCLSAALTFGLGCFSL
jgi:hypothetical protein